ncbi:unnamed protein product [Albugo candida]|uniref:Uncharacterized protein n=1 Tax=Albugo candida TaxID=65357 RepID=A0A024GS61_9STRA|nr:unnamed protein product [Albugo candida]|eukprot:CCI49758.1 unnamed protein product [Albugo candida]
MCEFLFFFCLLERMDKLHHTFIGDITPRDIQRLQMCQSTKRQDAMIGDLTAILKTQNFQFPDPFSSNKCLQRDIRNGITIIEHKFLQTKAMASQYTHTRVCELIVREIEIFKSTKRCEWREWLRNVKSAIVELHE